MKLLTGACIFITLVSLSSANNSVIDKAIKKPVQLIVIDPGFGGNDYGPSGCQGKVFAKDINLEISKKVNEKIKKDLEIDAILTRDKDTYLSLEERTAIANTKNADLLVSIHLNAAVDKTVNGIETYCLSIVPEPNAIRNAAMENFKNTKNFADMEMILSELMENTKVRESKKLADCVQNALVERLSPKYNPIRNRGVKNAPFYVLLAAEMPSIMVQVSFISNLNECRLLITDSYQNDISSGIVEGIKRYLKNGNQ